MEPSVPCVAVPANTTTLNEDPELIPTGQVSEMAPPINPFELMGKATGGSSSGATKGKGKGRGKGAEKKSKKTVSESSSSEQSTQATTTQEPPLPLPIVHEIDESDHGEDLAPPSKRGRSEGPRCQLKELLPVSKPGCPICCSKMGRSLSMIPFWTNQRQSFRRM